MAPIAPKTQLVLVALACCATGRVCAAAPAAEQATVPQQLPGAEQPIKLDAASSEVDYKSNTLVFKDVIISQGTMRVQADHAHATGLNFANSNWTFEGNVRINAEEHGNLRSDSAVVEFKDNHIAARHRQRQACGVRAEAHRFRTDRARARRQDRVRHRRRHRTAHR